MENQANHEVLELLELNIGLEVSNRFEVTQEVKQLVEGLLNTEDLVYLCKALLDAYEVQSTTAQSNTEKTAVIKFKTNKSEADILGLIARLSDLLRQDCIAVRINGKGHLIGTYASEWGGEFNPEYFISL